MASLCGRSASRINGRLQWPPLIPVRFVKADTTASPDSLLLLRKEYASSDLYVPYFPVLLVGHAILRTFKRPDNC